MPTMFLFEALMLMIVPCQAKAAKARADHIARKKRKKLAAAARAAKKAAIAAAKAARAARKAAAEKNKEKAKKLAEKAAKAKRTALKLKRAAARKRPIRISKPVKVSKRAMKKIAKKAGVRMKAPKSRRRRRRRRRRGSGCRRRQGSGNKPKFVGEERQSERAGGKTRTRNRKVHACMKAGIHRYQCVCMSSCLPICLPACLKEWFLEFLRACVCTCAHAGCRPWQGPEGLQGQ